MTKKLLFKKKLIDAETGEYITAIAFIPEERDKDFAKVYKLFGDKILRDIAERKITGGQAIILLWFLAKTVELPIQSDMWIPIDYGDLAKEIKLSPRVIRMYVKQLVEKGYLEQFKKRHSTFRLKPDYVYKGILVKFKESQPDF